jgi:hypothetical protein
MRSTFTRAVRRIAYLVPVAAVLYAIAQATDLDVLHRAVSVLASAVWGS